MRECYTIKVKGFYAFNIHSLICWICKVECAGGGQVFEATAGNIIHNKFIDK
mgnify:CR=1 FL=1